MHTDAGNASASTWSANIVSSAQARGVAVVSGRQMLEWLDGRNASSFEALSWNGQDLAFSVDQASGARNLRALLPTIAGARVLSALTRGGQPVSFSVEAIKGVDYAVFSADTGSYLATYLPDQAPPVLSDLAVQDYSNGAAQVHWNSNEPASSSVAYGTNPENLAQSVSSSALVTEHALTITGLAPATTVYYRVSSVDGAGNAAFEPPLASPPASFSTPCLADSTASDFAAGTSAGTVAGVDVSLAPAIDEAFSGTLLPPGWTETQWTGGDAEVEAGSLVVDGAYAGPAALFSPGATLEFSATFGGEPYQHVGFATDFDQEPWAIFSTGAPPGGTLKARTHLGSSHTDTELGIAAGAPHVFRIVWSATQVQYFVDGGIVATHPTAIATPMRPAASDYNLGGNGVSVDWLRLSPPVVPAGTFTSRIADAGHVSLWGSTSVGSTTPVGTSVAYSVRTGATPIPDASWSPFSTSNGQIGRYAQYRAELATSDPSATPRLTNVAIECVSTTVCGDGVREGAEQCDDSNTLAGDGCSPTCGYESADADGDGILNIHETDTGVYVSPTDTGTNPLDPDSDDDGVLDGAELAGGGNPLDPDSDDDGHCDGGFAARLVHRRRQLPGAGERGSGERRPGRVRRRLRRVPDGRAERCRRRPGFW